MRKKYPCISSIFFPFAVCWILIVGFSSPVYCQNHSEGSKAPIDPTKVVGAINGDAGVTPGGAATYQIPVHCPPGTSSVQPYFFINYSSQSANGSLGWGWELTGLSSITRTSKTLYQDGKSASPEMNNLDVYAIDGNRLLSDIDKPEGGEQGFYTSAADFSVVYAHGFYSNGPTYWTVRLKDGTVKEYGNSPDSRCVKSGDVTGIWRLNKITDPNGNYVQYFYNSEGQISVVAWTGNSISGQQPYNHLVFNYAIRADQNITYPYNSAPALNVSLLTEIQVFAENVLVKK
jgi:YD repeat-containing protein